MAETKLYEYNATEKFNRMEVDYIQITPAVTTAQYTVADSLFDTTEIPFAVSINGGKSLLHSIAGLNMDTNQEALGFDLYFWMNNMDWEAANEVMTGDLTRAEVLAGNFLGKVSMGTWSNLSNTCKTATEVNIGLTLAAASDSKSVYVSGVVTSGTPTLAAVDDIVLNLGIIKD